MSSPRPVGELQGGTRGERQEEPRAVDAAQCSGCRACKACSKTTRLTRKGARGERPRPGRGPGCPGCSPSHGARRAVSSVACRLSLVAWLVWLVACGLACVACRGPRHHEHLRPLGACRNPLQIPRRELASLFGALARAAQGQRAAPLPGHVLLRSGRRQGVRRRRPRGAGRVSDAPGTVDVSDVLWACRVGAWE